MVVHEMKEFNRSAHEFFSTRKEESSNKIHQSLLMITANWKDYIFESDDFLVIHSFLSNVQKVLINADRLPDLSWEAVEVLSRVCSTPSVRDYVTRSFNFMPILTSQLSKTITDSDESNHEKKVLVLLELMQEITYGIKITWQESYLQLLTTTLKDLVCSKQNETIVAAALGVLVNLCHDNQTVVGIITRTISVNKMLKMILKSHQHGDSRIRVEISKLIIALGENVAEAEPEFEFFMKATAPSLLEALKLKNASRMRQILAFLEEIVQHRKLGDCLLYSDCKKDVQELLSIVESNEVLPECLAVILRYLTVLTECEAKTGDIWEFSVTLFGLALNHANKRLVAKEALTLAAAIVSRFEVEKQSNGGSNAETIFVLLLENLPMLLSLLEVTSLNVEVCDRLSALMSLLRSALKIVNTRDIIQHFELSTFRSLFETLKKPELKNDNLFHASVYTFYVKTLTFLSELSDKEASWLLLFNQLLQEEDVQMVLSVALYTGPEEIKKQVLSLTVATGFSLECLTVMAKCMAKVNNLIVFSPAGPVGNRLEPRPTSSFESTASEPQSITHFQENRVNLLLSKVEKALAQNDSPLASSVIELYQVKVSSLQESRSRLERALEASDARAFALRQDLALAQVEFTRLHNLLPCQQLALEEAKKEKARLEVKIDEAERKANQISRSLKTKAHEIVRLNEEVEKITKESSQEIVNRNNEIEKLRLELQELAEKLNAQEMASSKNEESLQKQLVECRKEIDSKSQQIEQLKKEIVSQSNQMAKLEKSKNDVESRYLELKKHLNMISELSRKDI